MLMNKCFEFLKNYRHAIIWTFCYIFIVWVILRFLFNFDIFVWKNWIILSHAHLRGFPGFVFGILILSAIPMYIATTSVIIRTKKPLFTPKLPNFMEPVPEEKKTDTPELDNSTQEKTSETEQTEKKIIPTELRSAFIRARAHIGPSPKSIFDISNLTTSQPQSKTDQDLDSAPDGELPLPTDFDFSQETTDTEIPSFAPVFSDINFDISPVTETDDSEISTKDIIPVIEYLENQGVTFSVKNDIIFTDKNAISAHTDPDFWIADDEIWFAAGKQKPSPVKALLSTDPENALRPILYLGETNILNLEKCRDQWTKEGITVITDLNELK